MSVPLQQATQISVGKIMQHFTTNTARKDFDRILDIVIEFGESVSIATDKGAAILISQEEWNGLLETLHL